MENYNFFERNTVYTYAYCFRCITGVRSANPQKREHEDTSRRDTYGYLPALPACPSNPFTSRRCAYIADACLSRVARSSVNDTAIMDNLASVDFRSPLHRSCASALALPLSDFTAHYRRRHRQTQRQSFYLTECMHRGYMWRSHSMVDSTAAAFSFKCSPRYLPLPFPFL